jgi:hypothetical protein
MTDDTSFDKNLAQPAAQPPDDSKEVRVGERCEVAARIRNEALAAARV